MSKYGDIDSGDAPKGVPTFAQAASAPVVVDLVTASRWLGIGRTTAYRLAERDEFPAPILRIGHSYRVPTAPLLTLLGLPVAVPATPALAGPDDGARPSPGDGADAGDAAVIGATVDHARPGAPAERPEAGTGPAGRVRRFPAP